jgi:hypothetical protein
MRTPVLAGCVLAILLIAAVPGDAQTLLQRPLPGTPPRVPGQELQPPLRAPMTLTPTIEAGVEYNDNIFLDNRRREDDIVFVVAPGIAFNAERATWRLNTAYRFENRIYVDHSELDNAFDRQVFVLDSFYRVNPNLTLSLDDDFSFDTGINAFRRPATQTFATGRSEMWTNTIRPGVTWQADELTQVRGFLGWNIQRYEDEDLHDADGYHADVAVERRFTPRLRGIAGYKFAYFDVRDADNATTHTPTIGARYDFTPTLTGTLSAGPTIVSEDSRGTRVAPYVAADLLKVYRWGTTALRYTRDVGLSGGVGGTTDNDLLELAVVVSRVWRGLSLQFTPQFLRSQSDDRSVDVKSVDIPLALTYQFMPWFSVSLGYAFLHQTDDSTVTGAVTGDTLARDVDQNRVFFTLVFGYPIRFD